MGIPQKPNPSQNLFSFVACVISHSIRYVKMSIGNLNKQCGVSMYLVVCVLLEYDISLTRPTHSNVEIYILLS